MDSQLIMLALFLVFSVISSIYKRLKNKGPDETKLQRRDTRETTNDPFEEKEFDLSEWESLFSPQKPEPEPEPEPELETPPEFEEVHGKRPVSEADTGPEFQEVEGKRPVDETYTGPEFQAVEATRPVSDQSSYVEGKTDFIRASETILRSPSKRKRRHFLKFDHRSVRKAIIYNEILGPPRADNMPF